MLVNRILVAAVLTLSSCWRSHAFVPACPLNAAMVAEHRTGRHTCAWRMHSADVARRNVLKGMGALAAASAISGTAVPTPAKEAPYDTQKLADEWEGFLPERIVKRGGQEIRIAQEFNDKKKNGLAVYEGNLILTAYMESLGKDYWKDSRVLELGCGTGLGSITASVMGAASVTASDRENTVLALSDKNMKANIKDESKFRTAKISWGTNMCGPKEEKYKREIGGCWDASSKAPLVGRGSQGNSAYDVIIGADLTYTADLVPLMAKTLLDLSGPETEIILCWCEPRLFTFNSDVMEELNRDGIPVFDRSFKVERITTGPVFDAGLTNKDRTFILRMKRK